jgi:E3 ubiquitin-protein ligase TRIP12
LAPYVLRLLLSLIPVSVFVNFLGGESLADFAIVIFSLSSIQGFDDMFPVVGTSHARLRQMLTVLRGPSDDVQRLDALTQLCDYLSVGSEESMASFSIDTFVPPLVALLSGGYTADTMLLAARALTHMMDALPASAASISHHNAAPALCANLLSIEYIDLAEQSLAALEKLSVDFPQPIVRAGGFAAALSFIDFFSTGVQRMAAVTACNMCRSPPADAMDKIVDVLPAMMNLLNSEDQRIRESATLGFSRLADSFRTASDKLETLCGGSEEAPLVERVLSLVVPTSPPALAPQSYSAALRLLSTLSRGSAKLSVRMLAAEALLFKIRSLLTGTTSPHSLDCLSLADALLPETDPEADKDTAGAATAATTSTSRSSRRRRSIVGGSGAAFAAIDASRRASISENQEVLAFFGATLLPSLLSFYRSSADTSARRTALSVIAKLMALAPAGVLEPLVMTPASASAPDAPRFAPFVAGLLGENSSVSESLAGLSLADSTLSKLPSIKTLFAREGVVHELLRLEAAGVSSTQAAGSVSGGGLTGAGGGSDYLTTDSHGATTVATRSTGVANMSAVPLTGNATSSASTVTPAVASSGSSATVAVPGAASSTTATVLGVDGRAASMTAALQAAASARFPMRLTTLRHTAVAPDLSPALVSEVAKAVVAKYLNASTDEGNEDATVLDQLVTIALGLTAASQSSEMTAKSRGILLSFADILGNECGMSTFELLRSGVVDALLLYFAAKDLPALVRTERTVAFVEAMNLYSSKGPFGLLVARVLDVFASEENLPLCVSDVSAGHATSSIGHGLRQLAMPFKLCLRRAPATAGGAGLRDYSHHIVMIEPLATMSSVQDFLWSRVQGEDPNDSARGLPGDDTEIPDGAADLGINDVHLDDEEVEGAAVHDGGAEDADDEDEDETGNVRDGDGEEEMFLLDEDRAQYGDEHVDEDGHNSEDGYSSEEVIGEDEGGDDDMDGPPSFGTDLLGTSLPPVELDHDTLARSLAHSPRHTSVGLRRDAGAAGVSGSTGTAGGSGASGSGRAGPGRSRRNGGTSGAVAGSMPSTGGTPRSYAAALAAGMHHHRSDGTVGVSLGGPSPVGGRRPGPGFSSSKLVFTLNGRVVSKESSILHAILQTRNDGISVGPRLWTDVYTLTYSMPPASSAVRERIVGGLSSTSAAIEARPTRRSRRLSGQPVATVQDPVAESVPRPDAVVSVVAADASPPPACAVIPRLDPSEVLDRSDAFVPTVTISDGLPTPVRNISSLLKHLNWIARSMKDGNCLRPSSSTTATAVTCVEQPSPIAFQSQKVTAKLQRQLSDPLALCGGAIPKWCHLLSREASFLVPFETRQVLFQSTALGVARALHLLQLRFDVSSVAGDVSRQANGHRSMALRDSEARINRIQRQKVRIHRSRALESAMRVMSMYASHGTVLEVEYFDEVGTGLGPTLEFYTLVSRELQRVELMLWKAKESVKKSTAKEQRLQTTNISTAGAVAGASVVTSAGGSAITTIAVPASRPSARGRRRSISKRPSAATTPASGGLCSASRRDCAIEDVEVEYVVPTGSGLMPSCIPAADTGAPEYAQRLSYFPFVGRLVAKALSDGRLLDLRLSPVFCKLLLAFCSIVLKRETAVCAGGSDIASTTVSTGAPGLSPATASLMRTLDQITDAELWREFSNGVPGLVLLRDVDAQLASSLQNILDMANGTGKEAVADLCLSFVLPENDQIEVVDGGRDVDVTGDNAVSYVAAVVRYMLCSGVRRQAEALLRGFGDVLDVKSLLLFQPHELELLICGPSFEEWSTDFLVQATRCDHGFRHESEAVVSLLRVLSELDADDQRRFVLFATGSPALPVGGLMGLHPRLTIVKRTPEGGRSADECLPTVMTCTNYFKLPDYSSFETTKARLLYALREGQGSFHLS